MDKNIEVLELLDLISRYETSLQKIADKSLEHFAISIAQATLDGWDGRIKLEKCDKE